MTSREKALRGAEADSTCLSVASEVLAAPEHLSRAIFCTNQP